LDGTGKTGVSDQHEEHEFDPFAEPKPPRRRGGMVGWLALLLALFVAGFNGWQWWLGRQAEGDQEQATAELQQLRGSQAELAKRLDGAEAKLGEADATASDLQGVHQDLTRLQGRVDEAANLAGADAEAMEGLGTKQAELERRVGGVESAVAALATRGETTETRVELAEVDFLLRTANERLQLFRDARTAGRSLGLADAQLEALDDPLYLPVRRAIADARLALEAMPKPDVVGLTARLGRLQAEAAHLPFAGETAALATAREAQPETGIWARFKAALASLVTVRRRVPDESLVNLEDKDYVRQGLWLQLESARLALMRGDDQAWRQSLDRAAATLKQYFEPADAGVGTAQKELDSLRQVSLDIPLPDISAPWAQLRLLRDGQPAESAATDAAEEGG